ncbi:MAG TPA: hypothetical protein VN893_02795, partial [Bryobacteraceae bacterium]|nr:hypothetical protein [Bryobacteraceae bacterium]
RMWKTLAIGLGLGVVLLRGDWHELWPPHTGMDWRAAAQAINQRAASTTPVICPSPFVEGQLSTWRPNYPLPSFLYAPLVAYPVHGRVIPFPFATRGADRYAASLAQSTLPAAGRFFVYGHRLNAYFWENWYRKRPELAGWSSRRLGPFGDVVVVEFDQPGNK